MHFCIFFQSRNINTFYFVILPIIHSLKICLFCVIFY